MDKAIKKKADTSACHQLKEKERHRVNDLQGILNNLRLAMKESRVGDVAVLEEQVSQMFKEWNAELNEPTPTSSLDVDGSVGSFVRDIEQLLQLQPLEEEDDAISPLTKPTLKNEPHLHSFCAVNYALEDILDGYSQGRDFQGFEKFGISASSPYNSGVNNCVTINPLDHHQFDLDQGFEHSQGPLNSIWTEHHGFQYNKESNNSDLTKTNLHQDYDCGQFGRDEDFKRCEEEAIPENFPNICPPPSAFLGPICALWDCFRPVQENQHYCMKTHGILAFNEGLPCMTPILRPQGIGLKDSPLFATLQAKAHGIEVGIPICAGAASAKSPWSAPELFNLSLLEGETIREWLFFDKPRKAFESGSRKQRALPDYSGRWHESRKLPMHGGHKRSYYMDPQPFGDREWHLYEYVLINYDAFALCRIELKLVDIKKGSKGKVCKESVAGLKNEKSPAGKVSKESLADLEKKMGKLSASSSDNSPIIALREKTKVDLVNLNYEVI